jgi:beta-glucanase (GH16 family)
VSFGRWFANTLAERIDSQTSPLPAATEPSLFPTLFIHALLFSEIMKASLFSLIAAAALFTSTASFAAEGPYDHRYDDRNSKDFNYGYDRNHRVTDNERARWEAAHRRDDHFDRSTNYGYDRNHRVTAQERARWEAQQRENQLREAKLRQVQLREAKLREAQQREAPQRAQWEASHRTRR